MIITPEMRKILDSMKNNTDGHVSPPAGSAAYFAAHDESGSSQTRRMSEDIDLRTFTALPPLTHPRFATNTDPQHQLAESILELLKQERQRIIEAHAASHVVKSDHDMTISPVSKPRNFVATLDEDNRVVIDGGQVQTTSTSTRYQPSISTAPKVAEPEVGAVNEVRNTGSPTNTK